MSQLTKVIGLLYRMDEADEKKLAAELLINMKRIWHTALQNEARDYKCNRTPNPPTGRDLKYLKDLSNQHAASITRTWNRDAQRQIDKLYKENPRGNRFYYASRMEAWAAERAGWKLPQIAMNTEFVVTQEARHWFREYNLTGDRYMAGGSAPTCEICVNLFAAGVVDLNFVRQNPLPAHIDCPHYWVQVTRSKLKCDEIWLG